MNIATEAHISGKPITEQQRKRPVRMVLWFIIVGLLLALLVGAFVGFNAFRSKMIAQFFANNKPPPSSVSVAAAKSEVIPNLLTAAGTKYDLVIKGGRVIDPSRKLVTSTTSQAPPDYVPVP